MNENTIKLLLVIAFMGIPASIGIFLLLRAHTVVKYQAKFYRKTNSMLGRTPNEIDGRFQFPWDKRFIGRRSEFAEKGANSPKSYNDLILIYRVVGLLILTLSLGLSLVVILVYMIAPNAVQFGF